MADLREQVSLNRKLASLRNTGFTVDLSAAAFGPGRRKVRVAVVTADERAISEFPAVVGFLSAAGP